ncbi:hypothetical protein ABMA28_005477 [Loxostege sticticalis]|uniref:Alkaline phosphatase n=1 Tax=Loxostege sticticalis TaxID=481309 RepID=A0ABD0SSV2_LOXSC
MLRLLILLVVLAHPSSDAARSSEVPLGNKAEFNPSYWAEDAREGIEARLKRRDGNRGVARNVIIFLGDGMSIATLGAARALLGQREGHTGEEAKLSFEQFPTVGLSKTYCVDAQIADSACSATAYLCGVKTNDGTIGVTPAVRRTNCTDAVDAATHVRSIASWAIEAGKDAGIVTTTRVTHASPAGTYAHTAERDWEHDAELLEDCGGVARDTLQKDIAYQLVHSAPGNQLKVILGGGRRAFLPNTVIDEEGTSGRRADGRNLIEEWKADKRSRNATHEYVWNRKQLMQLSLSPPDYLLGLFEASHMQYHMQADPTTEPTLAELTEIAIRSLSRNKNGFFLFVEGGRIDHAHHDNYARLALDETIELSAAVTRATELLSEQDTLIVVTSDHAHVMGYNGYTHRGTDILGISDKQGDDNIPYTTLSYINGPGYRPHVNGERDDVSQYDIEQAEFQFPSGVPLDSETHGGDDVGVFALGPHHDLFTGMYEQTQIPFLMAYAGCFGPGLHACDGAKR